MALGSMAVQRRRIVMISSVGPLPAGHALYALCDDGSLWVREMQEGRWDWRMIPGPPGTNG